MHRPGRLLAAALGAGECAACPHLKWRMRPCTGQAAASPSAHIVCPSMICGGGRVSGAAGSVAGRQAAVGMLAGSCSCGSHGSASPSPANRCPPARSRRRSGFGSARPAAAAQAIHSQMEHHRLTLLMLMAMSISFTSASPVCTTGAPTAASIGKANEGCSGSNALLCGQRPKTRARRQHDPSLRLWQARKSRQRAPTRQPCAEVHPARGSLLPSLPPSFLPPSLPTRLDARQDVPEPPAALAARRALPAALVLVEPAQPARWSGVCSEARIRPLRCGAWHPTPPPQAAPPPSVFPTHPLQPHLRTASTRSVLRSMTMTAPVPK